MTHTLPNHAQILRLALSLCGLLCATIRVDAQPPPPPPIQQLRQLSLAADESSLLSYLQNGLPDTFVSPYAGDNRRYRWHTYEVIANALADMKSSAAVPVLSGLVNSPLPSKLASDLDRAAGTTNPRVNVAKERERNLYYFRAQCAEFLGQIGNPAAVGPLIDYARTLLPELKPNVNDESYPARAVGVSVACQSLGELGSSEGVEIVMQAMPDVPLDDTWPTSTLRILTGKTFGPDVFRPAHMVTAAREKWLAWWKENKGSFSMDRAAVSNRSKTPPPIPPTISLRDYIVESPYRPRTDSGPIRDGTQATLWLERNGAAHVKELAALTNDPDETMDVRKEAMVWYARFGGSKAMEDLTRYVRGDIQFDPQDRYLRTELQAQAFRLIQKSSSKTAYELSKDALTKGYPVSGFLTMKAIEDVDPKEACSLAERYLVSPDKLVSAASAEILMRRRPDGIAFVVHEYGRLDELVKREIVQQLGELQEPQAKEVFFDAVKSANWRLAGPAIAAIIKFKLEAELPEDSAKAFQDWKAKTGH